MPNQPGPNATRPPPGPTTPYSANPMAIPADLTPLVPKSTAPPTTGADDLDAMRQKLQSGVTLPG
jgi:hypothetical protein